MKYLVFAFVILGYSVSYSQVGIGTITPDPSSILEINSTNSGVLFPRLSVSQRNAISNPATGLLIYNTKYNSSSITSALQGLQIG